MDLRLVRKIPKLPNPEDGLRSLVEHAPRAEAMAEQMVERFRPAFSALLNYRRRAATLAMLALTAWLFVHVVFGANGTVVYRQKKSEYEKLQQEVKALQKENDRHTQQIKDLESNPHAIEKVAREQFGYMRQGEYVYVAPPPPQPAPPTNKSAEK